MIQQHVTKYIFTDDLISDAHAKCRELNKHSLPVLAEQRTKHQLRLLRKKYPTYANLPAKYVEYANVIQGEEYFRRHHLTVSSPPEGVSADGVSFGKKYDPERVLGLKVRIAVVSPSEIVFPCLRANLVRTRTRLCYTYHSSIMHYLLMKNIFMLDAATTSSTTTTILQRWFSHSLQVRSRVAQMLIAAETTQQHEPW